MNTSTKSEGWVRAVEIGLGIIVVILAIYALAYPGATFVSLVWILGIILIIYELIGLLLEYSSLQRVEGQL